MGLKSYITTMSIATLACWVSWGLVILMVNPETTNISGFSLFYGSLFLAIMGSGAVIGFLIRFIFLKNELAKRLVLDAFRQSFLLAFLVVGSLFLMSRGLFSWLNLFFLIAGLAALELFMISYRNTTK